MRLFVGIEPSPAFRNALAELQDRCRAAGIGGRYLEPSNLHLTLAFIGEWAEDVTAVLPEVEEPFSASLTHLGTFERAKVLWAGVEATAPLTALADRVRGSLTRAGIPFDPQSFNPHITLARKPILPPGPALAEIGIPEMAMTVREICLYRSARGEAGMEYTVIGRTKVST